MSMIQETLKCQNPVLGYQHKNHTNLHQHITTTQPVVKDILDSTHILTWNVGSLNTTLPGLHELISQKNIPPSIIQLQETKLTANKSTKYFNKLFPNYTLIFNNTHSPTTCARRPYLPYTPNRGGVLTMIHKNMHFQETSKNYLAQPLSLHTYN